MQFSDGRPVGREDVAEAGAPKAPSRYVLSVLALAALYLAVAKLGLAMDPVSGFATVVWPPTGLALHRGQPLIAGYGGQLTDRRDRAVEAGLPVTVDDQTRIGLQHSCGVERLGQPLGDPGDADIPGDVTAEIAVGEAEHAEPPRDGAAGMVAGQQEVGAARRAQHADRRGVTLGEQARGGCGHRAAARQ